MAKETRHNKTPRILTTGLAALLSTSSIGGEVRTTPITPVWQADGSPYSLAVTANNYGVSPGIHTDQVDFRLEQNPLDRYHTGHALPPAQFDFFGTATTDETIFAPGNPETSFIVAGHYGAGPMVDQGNGSLVFYDFYIPKDNTLLGIYHFNLDPNNTNLRNENFNFQAPTYIAADPVTIIPELAEFSSTHHGPEIPSDPNFDFDFDGDVDLHDWAASQVMSSTPRN